MGAALALGVAASLASAAHAAQVLYDPFDLENHGDYAANYTGFSNWDIAFGSVDLVTNGSIGVACVSGGGSCVDLDGTTEELGKLTSRQLFAFGKGDTVTLSFDLSGSQRDVETADGFFAGFQFEDIVDLGQYTLGGGWSEGPFDIAGIVGITSGDEVTGSAFLTRTISFVALKRGELRVVLGGGCCGEPQPGDNTGAVLDNVSLDITKGAAVPEPGAWALMLLGFAGLGAALRRRPAYA